MCRELNKLLKPDKQRAHELRREFEKGFDGIARRIWPNLTHVHGVVTGKKDIHTTLTNIYIPLTLKSTLHERPPLKPAINMVSKVQWEINGCL